MISLPPPPSRSSTCSTRLEPITARPGPRHAAPRRASLSLWSLQPPAWSGWTCIRRPNAHLSVAPPKSIGTPPRPVPPAAPRFHPGASIARKLIPIILPSAILRPTGVPCRGRETVKDGDGDGDGDGGGEGGWPGSAPLRRSVGRALRMHYRLKPRGDHLNKLCPSRKNNNFK